jgi:hypothetical protein
MMQRELWAMKYLALFDIHVFYITEWCIAGLKDSTLFTIELLDKTAFLFTMLSPSSGSYYYDGEFLTGDRFQELVEVVIQETAHQ